MNAGHRVSIGSPGDVVLILRLRSREPTKRFSEQQQQSNPAQLFSIPLSKNTLPAYPSCPAALELPASRATTLVHGSGSRSSSNGAVAGGRPDVGRAAGASDSYWSLQGLKKSR
eukprot:6194269-Pleurochrysis_carterae.AAC.2